MADQTETAVQLCERFYSAFEKQDLAGVLDVFAPDALVEIGAAGTAIAVEYSGIYKGSDQIERYYRKRFARGEHASAPIRPFCGLIRRPCIYLPWIIFHGEIEDTLTDRTVLYKGNFLHVWTVDGDVSHINSLAMHFQPAHRVTERR